MMKGGKDEESKAMGPLFPRLHVNDTSKGGPRAPPRNKMALYEQFSVPSQRLGSVSSNSTRPLEKSGNLGPSTSSNQGYGQEKPCFSSFNAQPSAVNSVEKVNNHQSTDSGSHTLPSNRKPLKLIRRESIHTKKTPISESSSRPTEEASRRNKSPSRKQKPGEEDDFMVPTLLDSGGKIGKRVLNFPEAGAADTGGKIGNGLDLNLERETAEERESGEEGEVDLNPDDIVGVIGPKLFLKTRRAIVHQQRIFAVQVFELHRLIKVQKLIAGSPHILLEDYSYLKKTPQPIKPIPAIGSLPHERQHSEEPQKLKQKPNSSEKPTTPVVTLNPKPNSSEKPTTPVVSNNQQNNSHIGSNVANNSAAIRVAPAEPNNLNNNNNNNPWYQPNQWLVPVMSPLEGLVYKPYSGPCPPAGSFMAPFFPTCPSPVTLPAQTGDFMNSAYGVPVQGPVPVPVPPQNIGMVGLPNYFPPFNMPVMNPNPNPNPNISTSAVEQISHLVLSNNNVPIPNIVEQNNSHSSCNMSQLNMWRFPKSRESELQGSTASSPFEKADTYPAPFFPMGMPGMDALLAQNTPSGAAGSMPRVIRVVPHNARTATESAARIFQSIQKDNKQN